MNKQLLLIFYLVIGILWLRPLPTVFAEEKISYTIAITIPRIIEHSQLVRQSSTANEDKKAEEENKNSNLYPFYELVEIVKTIIQEP